MATSWVGARLAQHRQDLRPDVTERLPSLLIELVLAGAEDATLADEGFTVWEVRAARSIVSRAEGQSPRQGAHSANDRANALTAPPG